MNKTERKTAMLLALLMSFRMLGLFMILPIFTLYAHRLPGTTPQLIGIALGIYGLTQACLQIPFGRLSDKFGRKPIIFLGLVIFIIGSIIAALSSSIYGIILGRALQGGGAVGSVIIALLADSTRDENRTKAMAILGMTIGLAFAIAVVLGPALNAIIGVPGIFWLTAILALIGVLILLFAVPTPSKTVFHRDTEPVPALFKTILSNTQLLRLDIGIFIQHGILTAMFIVLPIVLQNVIGIKEAHQWILYLPVLIVAYCLMVPFIIIAEKKRKMKGVFISCVFIIAVSQFFLWTWHSSIIAFIIALILFFTAFTILEASLPSLVSKIAPAGSKGTAMGIYSTAQFLGIFVGGLCGGWLFAENGISGVFIFCGIAACGWFIIAATMAKPPHLATKMFNLQLFKTQDLQALTMQLKAIPSIYEVFISPQEQTVYLKVDSQQFKTATFQQLLVPSAVKGC